MNTFIHSGLHSVMNRGGNEVMIMPFNPDIDSGETNSPEINALLGDEPPPDEELDEPACSECETEPCTCSDDPPNIPYPSMYVCEACGAAPCICVRNHGLCRPPFLTELRSYSDDAAQILGFIPPHTPKPPTFTKDSLTMDRDSWFQVIREHRTTTRQPYFGLELECFPRSNDPNRIANTIKAFHAVMGNEVWMIFKRDSTIRSGLEIVTAPMTLAEHQKRWPTVQAVLRKHCKAWGDARCGTHVHISRGDNAYCWALSKLDTLKMARFIHASENGIHLQALGGRLPTQYCRFTTNKDFTNLSMRRGNRHEALNLLKEPTVELRFFQGSTRVERILMAVEFAACLREYVKDVSLAECWLYDAFVHFAMARVTQYPNLVKYIRYVAAKDANLATMGETCLQDHEVELLKTLVVTPIRQLNLKQLYTLKSFLVHHDDEARKLCTSRRVVAKIRHLEKLLPKKGVSA